ncbi:MAG: hypothetical protein KAV98_06290 [Dehalococcoidia bacterium]|nr:hypothetical protein [Dehalococcoidia bacterium]
MGQAFVIIQIGNPQLDKVYNECIAPALKSCGLDPKRVDKHTEGRLLTTEIVNFIESADVIIADLTNERPNCYLEVGYAMGLDKFRNLILTAREDHNPDSPNYESGGHKVHFDLSGYDILFWDGEKPEEFQQELARRVRRRLTVIQPSGEKQESYWNEDWISKHREIAISGLKGINRTAFMEVQTTLLNHTINVLQGELLRQARQAQIHTFGWPIGIVLNRDELKPRPTTDGIVTEVTIKDADRRDSYDYWTLSKNGDFYLLGSIFEDERKGNTIFFNIRIVRITETLLYAARLYSGLNLPRDVHYLVGIRHGGLKGRVLSTSSIARRIPPSADTVASEDEVYSEVETTIEQTESKLVELVEQFTQPLFIVFNFSELNRNSLEEIVNKFVEGEVT